MTKMFGIGRLILSDSHDAPPYYVYLVVMVKNRKAI